jgi:hypothetical protein
LGGLWELLKNREHYDVYVCRRCGRLEFFVDEVGEGLRGEPREPQPLVDPDERSEQAVAAEAVGAEAVACLVCGATIEPANHLSALWL